MVNDMRKMPNLLDSTGEVKPVTASKPGNTQETAGIWSVEKESMCPACGKPMRRVTAAAIPVYICPDDRVVLPVRQDDFNTKN